MPRAAEWAPAKHAGRKPNAHELPHTAATRIPGWSSVSCPATCPRTRRFPKAAVLVDALHGKQPQTLPGPLAAPVSSQGGWQHCQKPGSGHGKQEIRSPGWAARLRPCRLRSTGRERSGSQPGRRSPQDPLLLQKPSLGKKTKKTSSSPPSAAGLQPLGWMGAEGAEGSDAQG